MTTMLDIACRDPIVARDGRPFGAGQGNRMRSLNWLLPSVLAGSLRTTLGKTANRDFSLAAAEDLLKVEIAGPFPRAGGQLYFPAPEDCVVHPERGPLRATPHPIDQGGCDLPFAGLQPVVINEAQAPVDFKPDETPAWWPEDRLATWLLHDRDDVAFAFDNRFLCAAEVEHRTHASIDSESGAAEDSKLFTTAALALTHLPRYRVREEGCRDGSSTDKATRPCSDDTATRNHPPGFAKITLAARVRADGWCGETAAKLDTLHPLGGERRLTHWKAVGNAGAWSCPEAIRKALAGASHVRMVLATPAVFHHGWKPGWLHEDRDGRLVGKLPCAEVTLRLVGVTIQRWRAVSGWSLANLPGRPRGPKPIKRIVPAGGVYFFETIPGEASGLADRWLEPVSDDEQERRDGFGLAVWGIW